jgi:ribonuclease P protein component
VEEETVDSCEGAVFYPGLGGLSMTESGHRTPAANAQTSPQDIHSRGQFSTRRAQVSHSRLLASLTGRAQEGYVLRLFRHTDAGCPQLHVRSGPIPTRAGSDEANLPAAQAQAPGEAWLSRAHEDGGWPQDPRPPARQGPEASYRLIGVFPQTEIAAVAGFPRERRIHRAAEIRAIMAQGRALDGLSLRMHVSLAPEPTSASRATVVVPRFRKTAVERNRLKRRLRELVRLHLLEANRLHGGLFVLRARAAAYERTFAELQAELLQLMERAAGHLLTARHRSGGDE